MIECNFSSISGARVRQTSQVAGHSASCTCSDPWPHCCSVLDPRRSVDRGKKKKETNLDQGYLDRSPEEVTFSQSIINFTYPIKKENSLSGFVMIFTIILRRKIYSKEKFGDEKRYFLFSILKVHHSRVKRNRHKLAPFQGSLTKLPSPPPPCSRVT